MQFAPVIVVGGGGHAKVLISTLLELGRSVLGFVDPRESKASLLGVSRLGNDQVVLSHSPRAVQLVNGVGSIGAGSLRREIYQRFHDEGYSFAQVIHPSASLASEIHLEGGVQIMAGVVVQPGCRVGVNAILNTGVCVDHDCFIGAHAHLAPGVVLSGEVRIAEGAHVGTGACVIQRVSIGADSTVGAGAVVVDDVEAGSTVVGAPARPIRVETAAWPSDSRHG